LIAAATVSAIVGTHTVGEGSVFAGSNDEHGIRNPESTHAKYFVLALGPENQ